MNGSSHTVAVFCASNATSALQQLDCSQKLLNTNSNTCLKTWILHINRHTALYIAANVDDLCSIISKWRQIIGFSRIWRKHTNVKITSIKHQLRLWQKLWVLLKTCTYVSAVTIHISETINRNLKWRNTEFPGRYEVNFYITFLPSSATPTLAASSNRKPASAWQLRFSGM